MLRMSKQEQIERRVNLEVSYIINNKSTIRQTAKVLGLSKSTIHKDIMQRLDLVSMEDAKKVKRILAFNKAQRHLRGGLATKLKYEIN